jgi:ABC-type multidrug transport system ATPase subunit
MISAVHFQNVNRIFSVRFALRRVDLDIAEGEAVAVTGSNGSGKTTLLRMMSTLLRPSSGEIRILGRDPFREAGSIRRRIGALFVDGYLYGDLTVRENLRFYGEMLRLPNLETSITEWLERLNLRALDGEHVRHLSKGEKQRVALIRSLLHDPALLLWDEPTSGLDESGRALFRQIALDRKGKGTIVCATHDFASIEGWVDRRLELENGRIR